MVKISDPVLFSKHFSIDHGQFSKLGIFDPMLNADTRLFVDPLLLRQSTHSAIREGAVECFDDHFAKIIKLLQHSESYGDVPWRAAFRLFEFPEIKETCIGYGGSTIHGSSIGPVLRNRLMRTAKQIVDLGIKDPELFALLSLLEENIGADRVSDMTTSAILPALLDFNTKVLAKIGVPTERFEINNISVMLPQNPCEKSRTGIILLPTDILRDLPVAHDWFGVASAAAKNQDLRIRVNQQIGDIWAIRTRKEKAEARRAVLSSKKAFATLLETVGVMERVPYDSNADPEGHYLWRKMLATVASDFPVTIRPPKEENLDELYRVVDKIVTHFVELIENNGLSYLLWYKDKVRHERAAQRLFFGIADAYCKAENLDICPETDSGAGPVDFKFSSGYDTRILVELKLSTGKVVHGYKTQLEIYKDAENTTRAVYVVIDVGSMGKKLETITALRNTWLSKGLPASKIVVVDGEIKRSASTRQSDLLL